MRAALPGEGAGRAGCASSRGYTGWGAGQLATEVRAGAWVMDRADARSIFAPDTEELWFRVHRILERLEARLAAPAPS